jgi:hypothetical protein
VKTVTITPEVGAILARSTVEDNIVRLPEGQLDRGLYAAVDKVLKALGGKWHTSKRGHVFVAGLGDQLAQAIEAGHVVDLKKANEQFFTPPSLAAEMVALAELHSDCHVLEPSAGSGRLIDAAWDKAGFFTMVEKDAALAKGLLDRFRGCHGIGIWTADFLEWRAVARCPVDRVLMNPPFSNGQDVEHVRRAFEFLRPGGKLVAIMSPHPFFAQDRRSVEFRQWLQDLSGGFRDIPAGTFKESGTAVAAKLISVWKPA